MIRLWPQELVGNRLVIGEGIETTLAAATCITHLGELLQPAWATGCANNMRRFPVIDGVEQLVILADNDASGTGQKAAAECAARWSDAGREVTVLIPPEVGTDFNDSHCSEKRSLNDEHFNRRLKIKANVIDIKTKKGKHKKNGEDPKNNGADQPPFNTAQEDAPNKDVAPEASEEYIALVFAHGSR